MLESLDDILFLLQSPYPVLVTVFAVVIFVPLLRKTPKKSDQDAKDGDKPVTPPQLHVAPKEEVLSPPSVQGASNTSDQRRRRTPNASFNTGGAAALSDVLFSLGTSGSSFGSNSIVNNNQDYSANTISGGSNNIIARGDNSPMNVNFAKIDHLHVDKKNGLDNLKEFVSFSALHDSSSQDPARCCHPGTRKNVLHRMRTWMDDPNAPEQILWLHGPTGIGKSAIAQTISSSSSRDKVGVSFFFFRSDPMRNDGNRLFPTLAWRLASSVPNVKDLIAFSLDKDPDLPRKAIEAQFDELIAQPFITISAGESAAPTPSQVIVIDGLDECSDEKLQRRILKIIGNAAADARFPLRFIISSRPEAYIEDVFTRFQHLTLQIDLADLDDAYRDIETYLISEFARIANEQGLNPVVWPGQHVIDTLVSNSSGQFVYASTVIKYVDDEHESAVSQLKIILGLKPRAGKSPFSILDALYTEILQRQPDKKFLKDLLAVLVARIEEDLYEEEAMLLGLNEHELRRKLRGMRSVLKSKPFIDVHHKSFLDFLDDSSRSGEYQVSKDFANRRYMELITDVLVKAASEVMAQPDSHGSDHFQPRFAKIIQEFPLQIKLPLNDLEEILQPLLDIQEKLLQLPHMSVPWKPRACEDCWTFYMIDDLLLHLACLRGSTQQEPKHIGIRPLTAMEEKQNIPELNLDRCLSSLLNELRSVELSLNMDAIGLVRALIRFDPTETAMKVQSMTDAQNLVELIYCLNKKECFKSWFGEAAHNATRLAVTIYARMPVLPRSLFLNSTDVRLDEKTYQEKAITIWHPDTSVWRDCFSAFMWGILSHDNMVPCLGICFQSDIVLVSSSPENGTVKWRRSTNHSVPKVQAILFEVAKTIQYVHSLDIALCYKFNADAVYSDSDNHAKLLCPYFRPNYLCKRPFDYESVDKNTAWGYDIRLFGFLFFEILFGEETYFIPATRPREPEIPDNVWQLIQWCCAYDPKERPTIDQVVQKMELWISLGQFTLST